MTEEPELSSSPEPKKPAGKGCLIFFLCVIGAIVLIVVIATLSSRGSSHPGNDNQLSARKDCERLVESRLKAPSTAKFSSTATKSSGEWHVAGTVDSQNSFGAMVRSSFTCTVTDDRVVLTSFE